MATTEVVMSGKRYTDEFKYEAAKQVLELCWSKLSDSPLTMSAAVAKARV
jgi:hypothetical protein